MTLPTLLSAAFQSTPLINLCRIPLSLNLQGQIWAKLEYLSPGHSKKDRVALAMVQGARRDGLLLPKQPVVELTSGNTGTGLAIVCGVLGHPFTAVMSRGNSPERYRMMKAFGAEVVLVDQAAGSRPGNVSGEDLKLVEQTTVKLVKERGAFRADQFNLSYNEEAHYTGTAPEIWSHVHPKAFVDFAGTGGTFSGCAKFFKEQDPTIHCAWLEPKSHQHKIQGGGYFTSSDGSMLHFEQLATNRGHVDEKITVTDQDAIESCRMLARLEGVFGGFSSGANLFGAIQLLRRRAYDPTYSVVFIVCDSGMKYLSGNDLY